MTCNINNRYRFCRSLSNMLDYNLKIQVSNYLQKGCYVEYSLTYITGYIKGLEFLGSNGIHWLPFIVIRYFLK